MTASRHWGAWVLLAIFATAIATTASDYSLLVPRQDLRYEMHRAIVDGAAPSPQRFRILVPWLLDPVIRAGSSVIDYQQAFRRVYFAFHFVALTALLAGIYASARLWFSRERALIGALIVGTVLHLSLMMGEYWDFSPIPDRSWFAPWSLLEPVFLSASLLLWHHRRFGLLVIVTAIAAVNSEASVVLPLLVLLCERQDRRYGLGLLATWLTITGFIHAAIGGFVWPVLTIRENLAHLPSTAINLGLFLGPAMFLAIRGYAPAPQPARAAAIATLPIVIGVALYGYWWDTRVLLTLYPALTPLLLGGIQSENSFASSTHSPFGASRS